MKSFISVVFGVMIGFNVCYIMFDQKILTSSKLVVTKSRVYQPHKVNKRCIKWKAKKYCL